MPETFPGPGPQRTGSGSGTVTGTGTANTGTKWSGASALTNASWTDDGATVTFNADVNVDGDLALVGATTGLITINGSTSGSATLSAENIAGSGTYKLPSGSSSHTLADLDSAQDLSNKHFVLTAAHGTDDTYTGQVITGLNAGATIAQWEAVYLGSSSTWLLADANGSGTYPARGLATAAYSNTNPATILVNGTVRNDAWNWTPGGTLYLSGSVGAITQTPPATSGDKVQAVGFALTADIAFFDFNSTFLTVT